MKTLLMTGVAGFIMSHAAEVFLEDKEIRIVGLDNLSTGSDLDNIKTLSSNPRFTFIKGDIRNEHLMEALMSGESKFGKIDGVIHGAAESHVDRSIEDPLLFVKTNVYGTANILNKVYLGNVNARVLIVSTDEVYGSFPQDYSGDAVEANSLHPSSPYAASKASADLLALSFYKTYGMDIVVTRCTNNYGPRQFREKLLPKAIWNVNHGEMIPIYGDGSQRRDWLYVEDHCRALKLVFDKGKSGEIYNISHSSDSYWFVPSNLLVIEKVLEILGKDPKHFVKHVADRPGHDTCYRISSDKIRGNLGWSSKIRLDEGLRKTVDWYKDRWS
jgi:dTDP-glucose 4,6-dehydratase